MALFEQFINPSTNLEGMLRAKFNFSTFYYYQFSRPIITHNSIKTHKKIKIYSKVIHLLPKSPKNDKKMLP